jgi:TonB family protein
MLFAIALWLALPDPQEATPAPPPTAPQPPAVTNTQTTLPATLPARPCINRPDSAGVYHHFGCGVTPYKVLHAAEPQFSEEARKKKIQGDVLIVLTVDTNGDPQDVRVFESLANKVDPKYRSAALSLDQQAIVCAKQYKFAPATYQGKPVLAEGRVEVNFQLF